MTRAMTMLAMGLWATVAAAQGAPEAETTPPAPAEPVRVVDSDLSLGAALKAKIDLTIGDVAVLGEEIDRVAVRLLIFCDKKPRDRAACDEHARDVAIRGSSNGEDIEIGVEHVSRAVSRSLRLRLEVRLPKRLAAKIDVRDGQVRVDDLLATTEIDVKQGTVDVALPEDEVAELDLRAGGEVRVERGGDLIRAKGPITGELRWTRTPGGAVRVKATSGVGDVRLVLR